MFWLSKKSNKKNKADKRKKEVVRGGKDDGQPPSSEEIREQALANARMAREAIGDETLERIAAAMTKKQRSATEQAKSQIASADAERVAEEILLILDEK